MNPKNLEGKTLAQQKNLCEVELIADFEMGHGYPENWSDDVVDAFDDEWREIQKKFGDKK
jgi:hypothetical protein